MICIVETFIVGRSRVDHHRWNVFWRENEEANESTAIGRCVVATPSDGRSLSLSLSLALVRHGTTARQPHPEGTAESGRRVRRRDGRRRRQSAVAAAAAATAATAATAAAATTADQQRQQHAAQAAQRAQRRRPGAASRFVALYRVLPSFSGPWTSKSVESTWSRSGNPIAY